MLSLLLNTEETPDNALLYKILKLDEETQWLLDKLSTVVNFNTIVNREAYNSALLSEVYDSVGVSRDKLQAALAEAYFMIFRNVGNNEPSLEDLMSTITLNKARLKADSIALVANLNKILLDTKHKYPIAMTAYVITCLFKERPWLSSNEALARLAMYLGIAKYNPEILSCSVSEIINFGNHRSMRSLDYSNTLLGTYIMTKLIYKTVCAEYIKQQLGCRQLSTGQLVLINDFTSNYANVGRINLLVSTLKEVYKCSPCSI